MFARGQKRSQPAELRLAAHLHDISAAQAIAIGLLKGWNEPMGGDWAGDRRRSIEVLEHVRGALRQLLRSVWEGDVEGHRPASVVESLGKEAKSLGVDLDLRLAGQEDWLTDRYVELVRLDGREAIRNVKRH